VDPQAEGATEALGWVLALLGESTDTAATFRSGAEVSYTLERIKVLVF